MIKQIQITVEVPDTPNYLRYGDRKVLPISDFTEAELREIGKQWTTNLVKKAGRYKNQRKQK